MTYIYGEELAQKDLFHKTFNNKMSYTLDTNPILILW